MSQAGLLVSQSSGSVTSVTGTTNEITASPTTGAVVLSTPSTFIAPGSIKSTTTVEVGSGNLTVDSGQIIVPDGSNSAPSYSFSSSTNSGLYWDSGNGALGIAAGGTEIVQVFGVAFLVKQKLQSDQQLQIKTFTSATSIVDGGVDTYLGITNTSSSRTVTLPGIFGAKGLIMIVKDESGAAGTNHITVNTSDSTTIDGASTYVISTNYGSVRLITSNGNWFTF